MATQRSRLLQSNRDMFLSMIPLVIVVLIVAGLAGQCAFSPGGPKTGDVPVYAVDAALQERADTEAFPIRNPQLPESWQSNSGDVDLLEDGGKVIEVGYITDVDDPQSYLRLAQTDAGRSALVTSQGGSGAKFAEDKDVAGQRWAVYTANNGEPLWVTELPGVQISITGSGTTEEFTVLAETVQRTEPLQARIFEVGPDGVGTGD